jgi:hypothetical protein
MAPTDGIIPTLEFLRLECLRLAHRHDFPAGTVIDRAREFEKFVVGTTAPSRPVTAPKGTKKDNPLA